MPRQTLTPNVDAKEDIVEIAKETGAGKSTEGGHLVQAHLVHLKAEVRVVSRNQDERRSPKSHDERGQNPEERTRDIIMYMATDILAEVMAEAEDVAVAVIKRKISTIKGGLYRRGNLRGNVR